MLINIRLYNFGEKVLILAECPFLSTYDNEIECFNDCALYNCKENGGVCPFKNLSEINVHKYDDDYSMDSFDNELGTIKESYYENKSEYA
jgi:hypothetical protein